MPRRLALVAVILLLVVALLSTAATWFLAYTEAGLSLVARNIPAKIGPVELEIGPVQGTFAGGFSVERFRLRHKRVHLDLGRIEARLELLPLLWQTIHVREARVGQALIEVKRRTEPPRKYDPRFLPRMLTVEVDRLHVEGGALVVPNGSRYEATDLDAAGVVRHKTIRLRDAALVYGPLRANADGVLRAADPLRMRGALRITISVPEQPRWRGELRLDGDLAALDLQGALTEPFHAPLSGSAHELTRAFRWQGAAAVRDFSLEPWGTGKALGRITGRLALRGDARSFEAQGPLNPEGLGAGAFDVSFAGSYARKTVTAHRIEITHPRSRARLSGAGTITIVRNGPQLELQGAWQDFRWPLNEAADPAFRSPDGHYVLRGVRPFEYALEGRLLVSDLPAMPFAARGALAADHITLTEGDAAAFGGQASLEGEAWWSPQERWRLAGRMEGLEPERIRRGFSGRVGFDFDAGGLGFGEQGSLELGVERLQGSLRGSPASGSGRFARVGGIWRFDQVRLRVGRTRLRLDGSLGEVRDLRFAIDAEDLGLLAPESRGRLHAQGMIGGTARRPIVTLDATGESLAHAGLALETLRADVDVDGGAGGAVHADVDATGLVFRERRFERIAIDLDGRSGSHRIAFASQLGGLALESEGTGSFADGRWEVQVGKLALHDGRHLALDSEAPFRFSVSADSARLEPMCLEDENARLCAQGESRAGAWSAALSAAGVPMSTLTEGLTPAVTYQGVLNADAQLSGARGSPWQGSLRVGLSGAQISHKLRGGRVDLIPLGSGSLSVEARPETIVAAVDLDARETGTIRGAFTAQRSTEAWRDHPLRGDLQARTGALGIIRLYFPNIDRATGRLDMDVVLGGTLGAPLVSGLFRVEDAEIDLYQVNLALRDLDLSARLHDNGLVLDASGLAGEGSLRLSGTLRWENGAPFGQLNFSGTNLRVVDVPEARIDASPNLDFKILGRRLEVSGGVRVPSARIVPANLADAVLPSGDEVIVGAEQPDPATSYQVSSNIMMTLGDQVSIDTFGLTGRITGSVAVRTDSVSETSRGRGELNIEEGQYTTLGRRLDIQRGRLIFTGGLLTNPGVDIRAAKRFPDIVAGVNVRGTLQQPRLTFFSEPSIPQSQIVSLILAGGSLEAAQNDPTAGSTRNELLSQGGAILAAQLGSRIGLEEVTIESTLDNETALVLGKYLSPRLYVSYGISLTESINTFKARYTLGDHWTLKTESGQEQSAELVYTIDK